MRENLFGAGLALNVLFLVTFPATGNAEEQKEVLYASPGGGLRIERNDEKAWVISTKNPDQRAELPPLEGISPFDDEFHASPNDEWIFGVRKMAHGFSNGDLFHRVDPEHVEVAPTQEDQSFNDRVWPYCVKQGALKAKDRKSTRLNSSHRCISYAVFCLKKKKKKYNRKRSKKNNIKTKSKNNH